MTVDKKKDLKQHIEDMALTKDVEVTVHDKKMAKRLVEEPKGLTIWELFYGPGFAAQVQQAQAKQSPKARKPRGEQDQHVSKGPDPYKGQHRDDGRGNRTGKPIRKKLTVDQVKEIKRITSTTSRPNKDIAREFGVSRETISHIRRGIRWAEV
ncbi:MAG: hypothetical protein H6747_09545 [Deltaproteobacteria bacterium]|nr:hypothetical protein [Deltaproteobacteria bacterium]